MAGEGTRMAGRRLAYALGRLGKDALIDLVIDRARVEIGDDASDEALADAIQGWIDPVLWARRDRPMSIRGTMEAQDRMHEEYRRRGADR